MTFRLSSLRFVDSTMSRRRSGLTGKLITCKLYTFTRIDGRCLITIRSDSPAGLHNRCCPMRYRRVICIESLHLSLYFSLYFDFQRRIYKNREALWRERGEIFHRWKLLHRSFSDGSATMVMINSVDDSGMIAFVSCAILYRVGMASSLSGLPRVILMSHGKPSDSNDRNAVRRTAFQLQFYAMLSNTCSTWTCQWLSIVYDR